MGRFAIVAVLAGIATIMWAGCHPLRKNSSPSIEPPQASQGESSARGKNAENSGQEPEFDPIALVQENREIEISPAQVAAKIPHLRFRVELGDAPVLGPANAPVTIVMFSDFECPFCYKGHAIMNRLREQFPEQIRLAYKAFPISQHPNALMAALMAEIAKQAGKFWEFHALLFSGGGLEPSKLFNYAVQIGLDSKQIERDLDELKGASTIMQDLRQARRLDVTSTPVFFINGRRLRGARSPEIFRDIVEEELELRRSWGKKIEEDRDYYGEITRFAYREIVYDGAEQQLDQDSIYPVELGDSPQIGPRDAMLTVVVFGDFECPYCARGAKVLASLRQRYGDKMRVVYKHLPLPFHRNARPAARASMVAYQAGKFWEFYGQLYEREGRLSSEDLRLTALRLQLDSNQIESALRGDDFDQQVRRDLELARALGIDGAPTFFVNGRPVTGARPEIDFRMLFAEELQRAQTLLDRGVEPSRLYEHLCGLK